MSFNQSDVVAYQDYANEFSRELMSKFFIGFETADVATLHAGLRTKKVLTEMIIGDLIQVWRKGFNPTSNAFKFVPREIDPKLVKVDLSFYVQELHDSYLGELARRKNASPDEYPFPQYLFERIITKMNEEKEFALWNGEISSSPADGDLLSAVINGYQKICAAETAAGNLTPVVTGAITNSNAIESAEEVYKALSPATQRTALTAFVGYDHMLKLQKNYQTLYGAPVGNDGKALKFGIGIGNGGVTFRAHAGIDGDFMLMTPSSNLHYSYAQEGSELLRLEKQKRELIVMADFWIDAQIGIVHNDILRTNDQALT